jgi:class 3 adenylate cyclase
LARLEDLDGFVLDDLGPQALRGRAATVRVYAVTTHRGRGSLS